MKKEEELSVEEIQELLFIQYEMALRNAGLARKPPTTLKEVDDNPHLATWARACELAGIDREKLNERLYKDFPSVPHRNCLGLREYHSWDGWIYKENADRYESECALMGCDGLCWVKDVIAQTQPVVKNEGSEHIHAWSKWRFGEQRGEADGLFYYRKCACGAEEATNQLLPAKIPIMIRGQENWESLLKLALSK